MNLPSEALKQRVVDVLGDLVRIDTTNPPGNETECARYLADLLAPAGIETRVVESAPRRGNLIARLRGSGGGRPLLLMGHLDVVPADPTEWLYPPFAAQIHDGFMWGRGTTDMKDMVALCAVIMLALAQSGQRLQRDVLFLATADEEHGGRYGMAWLAANMPELFDAACALNEGGGHAIEVGGHTYYTCQSAEKGLCRTMVTVHSNGGHGSHPRLDIAPAKLCRALGRLGDGHLAGRAIATMRAALRTIAADKSPQAEERVDALLAGGRIEEAMRTAGFDQQDLERYRPLFHDTVSITGLRAGDPQSINVIPATACAYLDGRILPGQTRDGFLKLLGGCLNGSGDPAEVEIEVYNEQFGAGLESPSDAPIVALMSEVIAERCAGARLVPWQCAGATDARHVIPLGVPVFGFVPARPLPKGVEDAGAHSNNERLWLENLPFALEVLYDVAARFCNQV